MLFAGDALAVVGGKLRFMARPVTLELDDATRLDGRSAGTARALRPAQGIAHH